MKLVLATVITVFANIAMTTIPPSEVDCSFDNSRNSFCGWERERNGKTRAGWRVGNQIARLEARGRKYISY